MEIIHTTTKDSISMPTLASDTVAHSLADERKQNVDSGYYSCSNVDESKLYDNPNMQKETLQNPKLLENFHRSPNHEKTLLNGRHTTIDVHSTGLYSTNGFTRMGNDNMVDGNGNHINRLNLKASSDGSDSGLENDCQKMIPTCKTCPTCATMCLTSNSIVHSATDNRHSYNKDIITTATMTSQSNSISRPKEKLDLAAQDLAMKIEFCLKFGYTVNQIRAALSKLSYKATKNDILGELFKFSTAQSVGHIPHGHTSLPAHVDIDPQFPYLDKDYQSVNVQPGELVSHGISTSQSMLHARGPSTLEHGTKSSKESDDSENLRPIVIDGSNVAMSHGNKQYFSCKGIAIAVDHFRMRNHRDITVFIPTYRKESSRPDAPIKDREILDKLEQERILVYTPSRCINGKRVTCYDDRFILRLAQDTDGVIVSNDNFRDLQNEKPEWKELIEKRLLMYSFVNDLFMPPDDPLGRNGPSLDNFLRKRPASEEQSKPQCPYGKKCTYGKKCKYFHPECAYSHKSVTDRLKEKTERRLKASNVAHSLAEEIVNSPKSIVTDQGPPQPNAAENETKNLHEQVSLGPRVQMEPQGTPNSSNCASYPQPVDLAEQLKQQAVISTPSPTHLPGPKSTPQYSPAVSQPPPGPHNHIFMNPNPCLEPRNKMLSSPAAFTGYENNSSHQVYYNMSHPTPFQQMAPQSYIQYHQVPYHDLHYPSPHQRVMYSYPNMQLPPNMMPPRMYIAPNPNSDGSAFSHSYPLLPSPERGLIHIQPHVRTCHTDSDPKTYPPRTTRRAVSSPHHPCDMGAQNQPALPLDSPQNPRYNLFKNLCGLFPRITVEKVMHSNPDISLPKELIKMCLEESS